MEDIGHGFAPARTRVRKSAALRKAYARQRRSELRIDKIQIFREFTPEKSLRELE
jgi:hypothetical protein